MRPGAGGVGRDGAGRLSDPRELRTARLRLVPLAVDDAPEMTAVLADPALYAFTGGEPGTLEELRATFAHLAADRSTSRTAQLNWVVRHQVDGKAIGMLQASFSGGGHAAEIAWVVGCHGRGRGSPPRRLAPSSTPSSAMPTGARSTPRPGS